MLLKPSEANCRLTPFFDKKRSDGNSKGLSALHQQDPWHKHGEEVATCKSGLRMHLFTLVFACGFRVHCGIAFGFIIILPTTLYAHIIFHLKMYACAHYFCNVFFEKNICLIGPYSIHSLEPNSGNEGQD